MSEKLTRITLPGQTEFKGLMDWGKHTLSEMVAMARDHAAILRAEADAIDFAADADFQVDVVRGAIVQHHVETLQEAKKTHTIEELIDKARNMELASAEFLATDGSYANNRPVAKAVFTFIDGTVLTLPRAQVLRPELANMQFKLRPEANHS